MLKAEIQIGSVYLARVSGKLVEVRITRESRYGGWDALSLKTGRAVRIKTAGRLRPRAHGADILIRDEGNIYLFRPMTDDARTWLKSTVQEDAMWHGTALVVEHRFVDGLIELAVDAGMKVA